MKVRVPHYYDTFSCTGSACPDTCCVGWMIEIDDASYERFLKMEGEFGERIRKNIIEREDGRFFALNENGKCAFLNDDNLCEMVIKLGDKSLCALCDNYPRVGVEFGDLREMGLSLSCPEVSKLVMSSDEPIRFGEWFQDEEITETDYTKDALFQELMDVRDVVFGILQNRKMSIADRIALYIMLASNIQNVLDDGGDATGMVQQIRKIAERFSEETYQEKSLKAVRGTDSKNTLEFVKESFQFIDGLEIINEKWIALFDSAKTWIAQCSVQQFEKSQKDFRAYYQQLEYVYEHLMVYYVYRYFMKLIFDGDLYSKAVMCAMALIVIREINVAEWVRQNGEYTLDNQIYAMYLFSKEIEHCEENMERLAEEFWENEIYQPQSVIDNVTNIL